MVDIEAIKNKLAERGTSQKDFEEKIDLLNKLAYDIRLQDPEKSVSISEVALDTSKKINYEQGTVTAMFHRALAKEKQGKLKEALKGYEQSVSLYEKTGDRFGFARATRAIGKIHRKEYKNIQAVEYFEKGSQIFEEIGEQRFYGETISDIADAYHAADELALALEYYLKTMDIFTELGDRSKISIVYNRIAVINMRLGETEEALEYYHKSIELKRELGDRINEALTLLNVGNVYHGKQNYDEALNYYKQALEINLEIDEKVNASICNINIADTLIKLEKLDEVEKILDRAKEVIKASGEKHYEAHLYLGYARLYHKKKEFYEAIHFVNDAMAIAEKISSKDLIMECYMCYSECYSGLEDYEKAHEYFRKYYDVKNEMFSKEMYEKIKNMQYKHEREAALKEAETQKKRGEELEKALKQVEQLNEDLKKMNEEKNTFMALVAHDLKNPLNAIMGYAQLVNANPEQFTQEEYNEAFTDIEVSARIMTELITNYLEFTTIEAGKISLDMRETDLCGVAAYVADSFKSRTHSKGIELILETNPGAIIINADKNALTQILDNLVSNAVKFSPVEKKVIISVEKIEGMARCTVKDEGPGIKSKDKAKLFKKFSRLSAKPTAGESSTGLGLSISKRLTEDMGGKIYCESEEDKGASFVVEFPVSSF